MGGDTQTLHPSISSAHSSSSGSSDVTSHTGCAALSVARESPRVVVRVRPLQLRFRLLRRRFGFKVIWALGVRAVFNLGWLLSWWEKKINNLVIKLSYTSSFRAYITVTLSLICTVFPVVVNAIHSLFKISAISLHKPWLHLCSIHQHKQVQSFWYYWTPLDFIFHNLSQFFSQHRFLFPQHLHNYSCRNKHPLWQIITHFLTLLSSE